MEKEFVPYELALRMKALGFDEHCFAFYQKEYTETRPIMVDDSEQYRLTGYRTCRNSEIPKHYISAPTWQSAFRWFRKEHYLSSTVSEKMHNNVSKSIFIINELKTENKYFKTKASKIYLSYEEAELACLEKLIEIVETKSKFIE